MSLASVRAALAAAAPDIAILEHEASTASVAEAAAVHGVAPGRIAKTLSLHADGRVMLVVVAGDARLDNRKARAALGGKASMLGPEEVERLTGHPVGGVCPFGLSTPLPVYCDVSLRAYDTVIPAAGSTRSSLVIAPDRLAALAGAAWVDVCQEVGHSPPSAAGEPA